MKDEGRIALEVSIMRYRKGQDAELCPWFCFLDSWNGYELTEFINHEIRPRLTKINMPMVASQLFITPRKEAMPCS